MAYCNSESPLSLVIVRLGGFRLLLSFVGAIEYVMDDSGLQDILSTIYLRQSTEKMRTGLAYLRAIRGHILPSTGDNCIINNGHYWRLESDNIGYAE